MCRSTSVRLRGPGPSGRPGPSPTAARRNHRVVETALMNDERVWLKRAVLVLFHPRDVLSRLRDDSDDAARARGEALLALVWLAGIAGVLWTPVGGRVLNDANLD